MTIGDLISDVHSKVQRQQRVWKHWSQYQRAITELHKREAEATRGAPDLFAMHGREDSRFYFHLGGTGYYAELQPSGDDARIVYGTVRRDDHARRPCCYVSIDGASGRIAVADSKTGEDVQPRAVACAHVQAIKTLLDAPCPEGGEPVPVEVEYL